jgi:voltage-gated potassium channel
MRLSLSAVLLQQLVDGLQDSSLVRKVAMRVRDILIGLFIVASFVGTPLMYCYSSGQLEAGSQSTLSLISILAINASLWATATGFALIAVISLYESPGATPMSRALKVTLFPLTAYSVMCCILGFALIYVYLAQTKGAFYGGLDSANAVYFSIVTFATVGYGDIYPTSRLAREFVSAEIITSMLYQVFIFSVIAGFIREK